MTTTAYYIAAGTLLGLLQMALGIGVGLWIRRGNRADACLNLDEGRARELIGHLAGLTSGISQDVQGHQDRISQINDRLTASRSAPIGSLTDIVVGVVGEVLRANQDLQQRLTSAEAQLQQQSHDIASYLTRALTDELTGLPNRRAFDNQLRQRLEGFARHRVPFSLMLIDVDYFKSVNDTHGHIGGDRVLCTIAQALRTAMRKPDFVARYGGEEFAALLPYTSLEEAAFAARHARRAVQAAQTLFDGATISVTASVGLASIAERDDVTSIVKRADDALYASKSGGRNCGHVHDGLNCVRIEEGNAPGPISIDEKIPEPVSASWRSPAPVSPQLMAACAELRDFAVGAESHAPSRAANGNYCKL